MGLDRTSGIILELSLLIGIWKHIALYKCCQMKPVQMSRLNQLKASTNLISKAHLICTVVLFP